MVAPNSLPYLCLFLLILGMARVSAAQNFGPPTNLDFAGLGSVSSATWYSLRRTASVVFAAISRWTGSSTGDVRWAAKDGSN